jgi:hypothetical protein
MLLDAVDYEMDVYEAAMCDPSDGGADAFFRLEHSGTSAIIPHDKVHFFFPFFHNIKMRSVPCRLIFFPIFVPYVSFSYMYRFDDRYSSSSRVGIVDVAASSSLHVLVSGEFSHRSIGLLYLEGNSHHVIYFSNFQN